ncbi:hypothetical protein LTR50_004419 [Elasticomyces elasticus]|nr:hypothetical protein LTR50_004419 [Elasticomyces elasticus]
MQSQVVFECRTACVQQVQHYGKRLEHSDPVKHFDRYQGATQVDKQARIVYESWRAMINLYSGLKFTYLEDKLVALAGLAMVMQQQAKDEYLAGIWRSELGLGFLWERTGAGQSDQTDIGDRSESYVAPSWSWASMNHRVHWDDFIFFSGGRSLVSLLETHLSSADDDPTGRLLRHSHITVSGRIIQTMCRFTLQFLMDKQLEVSIHDHTYNSWLVYDDPAKHRYCNGLARVSLPLQMGPLLYLPIVYCAVKAYGTRLHGILLRPAGPEEHSRRVARLEVHIAPEELEELLLRSDRLESERVREIVLV